MSTCFAYSSSRSSSRHDTVSTNTLGTLPCSFPRSSLIGAYPMLDIFIVDTQSSIFHHSFTNALMCSVCTSAPNNIVCGLAPSPTYFPPSSPLPKSQSTIIDNFFPFLLCIAQTEGEYEAVFGFVQGVYAGEGAETIINVWASQKCSCEERRRCLRMGNGRTSSH